MSKALLIFVFSLIPAIWPSTSYARNYFGANESLSRVTDVGLKGPNGEDLSLARKVTFHSFFLPYKVTDDGYVLRVEEGSYRKFYQMPDAQRVKVLQEKGYLPNPLPNWQLPLLDKFFGNLLWIFLAWCVGYLFYKKVLDK